MYVHETKEVPRAEKLMGEMKSLWDMQMNRKRKWSADKIERVGILVRQGIKYGKYLHEM